MDCKPHPKGRDCICLNHIVSTLYPANQIQQDTWHMHVNISWKEGRNKGRKENRKKERFRKVSKMIHLGHDEVRFKPMYPVQVS